jgi:TRAP-type C4-dicarboxylate transport system permease small subunit
MVIVVLLGIFSRTFTDRPFFWTEELARYTMIYAACLSIGLALKRGLHIGITFVLKKISWRIRIYFDIITRLCIFTFLITMTVKSIQVCHIVSMQESPTMGFNMAWVFIITPITCILQIIFLATMTIEDIGEGFIDKHLAMRQHNIEF